MEYNSLREFNNHRSCLGSDSDSNSINMYPILASNDKKSNFAINLRAHLLSIIRKHGKVVFHYVLCTYSVTD